MSIWKTVRFVVLKLDTRDQVSGKKHIDYNSWFLPTGKIVVDFYWCWQQNGNLRYFASIEKKKRNVVIRGFKYDLKKIYRFSMQRLIYIYERTYVGYSVQCNIKSTLIIKYITHKEITDHFITSFDLYVNKYVDEASKKLYFLYCPL